MPMRHLQPSLAPATASDNGLKIAVVLASCLHSGSNNFNTWTCASKPLRLPSPQTPGKPDINFEASAKENLQKLSLILHYQGSFWRPEALVTGQ